MCIRDRYKKTKYFVMGMGEWKGRLDWSLNWLTASEDLKITGIIFSPTIEKTAVRNWTLVNSHILGIVTTHAPRNMTVQQRSKFVKSFYLSRAIFIAKVLECPHLIAEKILQETQRFIWYGQMERPKKGVSYMEAEKGGLDFKNPQHFFKALLVKKFIDDLYGEESAGKELLQYWSHWRAKELKIPTGPWTNAAKSDFYPPQHVDNLLETIQQLKDSNIVQIPGKSCHKQIYEHWI